MGLKAEVCHFLCQNNTSQLNMQSTIIKPLLWHSNFTPFVYAAQHMNAGSTNSVSLGRGYLFVQPMADEECSGNLFENSFLKFCLVALVVKKLHAILKNVIKITQADMRKVV